MTSATGWSWVTEAATAPGMSHTGTARYLVLATATGAFAGKENKLATLIETDAERWAFEDPGDGHKVFDRADNCHWQWLGDAGEWTKLVPVHLKHAASIASLPAAWAKLPFDTTVIEDTDQYTVGSGGTAGEITILRSGKYGIHARALFAVISTICGGELALARDVGAGFVTLSPSHHVSSGMMYSNYVMNASAELYTEMRLDAGDKVRLDYQIAPGASAGTGGIVADSASLYLQCLGDWGQLT
jgi:hypothetical protein